MPDDDESEERKTMANHLCPSCGYEHPSEGGEVPAIEVRNEPPPLYIPPEGFKLVEDVRPVDAAPLSSVCPLCRWFESGDAEEFNQHMHDNVHAPTPQRFADLTAQREAAKRLAEQPELLPELPPTATAAEVQALREELTRLQDRVIGLAAPLSQPPYFAQDGRVISATDEVPGPKPTALDVATDLEVPGPGGPGPGPSAGRKESPPRKRRRSKAAKRKGGK